MPQARARANGAAVINGKIYVAGGLDSTRHPTKSLYVYNPGTNTWTKRANTPDATHGGISALYVVASPSDALSEGSSRMYRYAPAANTWARLAMASYPHHAGGRRCRRRQVPCGRWLRGQAWLGGGGSVRSGGPSRG